MLALEIQMKKGNRSKTWNEIKREQTPRFSNYANYQYGKKGELETPGH